MLFPKSQLLESSDYVHTPACKGEEPSSCHNSALSSRAKMSWEEKKYYLKGKMLWMMWSCKPGAHCKHISGALRHIHQEQGHKWRGWVCAAAWPPGDATILVPCLMQVHPSTPCFPTGRGKHLPPESCCFAWLPAILHDSLPAFMVKSCSLFLHLIILRGSVSSHTFLVEKELSSSYTSVLSVI